MLDGDACRRISERTSITGVLGHELPMWSESLHRKVWLLSENVQHLSVLFVGSSVCKGEGHDCDVEKCKVREFTDTIIWAFS